MNSSAFEKVLLSAILTSCAVFSVLMVAFLPRRPEPITIESLDRIESTEEINQRDVVIRHIGMSIVVSVAAGITTAELTRKWRRSREAVLEGQQVFSAQAMLQAVAVPAFALPGHGTTSFSGVTSNGIVEPDRLEFRKQAVSVLEPDRMDALELDALEQPELPLFLFQPSVPPFTEDVSWFSPTQPDTAFLEPSPGGQTTCQLSQTALAVREAYQTCRIFLPDAPDRVFAILFDGQHYRFVKIVVDREQAFCLVKRLEQRGATAVTTNVGERYAVWSLEPEAHLEAMA